LEGKPLALAVLLAGAFAIGIGVYALHSASTPPAAPERPRPPPPAATLANSDLRFSPVFYRTQLEQDAKAYGIPAPSWDEITQPNPYFDELKGKQRLRIKAPVETRHLRVSLEISKAVSVIESQTIAADHLVLRIENRTPLYLAYRIQTSVAGQAPLLEQGRNPTQRHGYRAEPDHPAHRVPLSERRNRRREPHRSDGDAGAVCLLRVTTPAQRDSLRPTHFFRTCGISRSRRCQQTFSWHEIKDGIDQKQFDWRDVIDYYARHNCNEYSFFKTYRYRTDSNAPLPARPLD
jgi:hypothetical protein